MRRMMVRIGLLLMSGDPGPLKQRLGSWMLKSLPGMLTCEEFEAFVHDYHEGTLGEKQRRRFDLHMEICPRCRTHFDDYVRTVALGQRLCEDDETLPEGMPEELVGAILLAVEENERR
ncbi:MAG: zf-HC2 domain-containing protein [Myxococcota bacterium]|nr:zf-HC2 domain-containing protein [Myxococcota bacterium]